MNYRPLNVVIDGSPIDEAVGKLPKKAILLVAIFAIFFFSIGWLYPELFVIFGLLGFTMFIVFGILYFYRNKKQG